MSNQLTVNKTLSDTGWTITASLNSDATIPRDIFAYLNTGTTELGEYQGVVTITDLSKMQVWNNIAIPIFGNKFVRHDTATIYVDQISNPDTVISVLKTSVQIFSTAFQANDSSSTVYTIT